MAGSQFYQGEYNHAQTRRKLFPCVVTIKTIKHDRLDCVVEHLST